MKGYYVIRCYFGYLWLFFSLAALDFMEEMKLFSFTPKMSNFSIIDSYVLSGISFLSWSKSAQYFDSHKDPRAL